MTAALPTYPFDLLDLVLVLGVAPLHPLLFWLVVAQWFARRSPLVVDGLLQLAERAGAPAYVAATPLLRTLLPGASERRTSDSAPAALAAGQSQKAAFAAGVDAAAGATALVTPPSPAALPTVALATIAREDNILLVGNKDSGKTTLLHALLRARRSVHVVFDPHAAPQKWPGDALVVGGGLDFATIMRRLIQADAQLRRRYGELHTGAVAEGRHAHCTLVADEWRAIVQAQPDAGKVLLALLTQGRKVGMAMIAASHGDTVESLGVKGDKDAALQSFDWIIYMGGFVRQRVAECVWEALPTTTTPNGKLLPLVVVAHNTTEGRDYLLDLRATAPAAATRRLVSDGESAAYLSSLLLTTPAPHDAAGLINQTTAGSNNPAPGANSVADTVTAQTPNVSPVIAVTVTAVEAAIIAAALARNIAPSIVARQLPGYTPTAYKLYKAKVDHIKALLDQQPVAPSTLPATPSEEEHELR